jgi:hypothetical protein
MCAGGHTTGWSDSGKARREAGTLQATAALCGLLRDSSGAFEKAVPSLPGASDVAGRCAETGAFGWPADTAEGPGGVVDRGDCSPLPARICYRTIEKIGTVPIFVAGRRKNGTVPFARSAQPN